MKEVTKMTHDELVTEISKLRAEKAINNLVSPPATTSFKRGEIASCGCGAVWDFVGTWCSSCQTECR